LADQEIGRPKSVAQGNGSPIPQMKNTA